MNVCVLDFETTGFDPKTAEVIEYACVRLRNGEVSAHIASLCRPLRDIPYDAYRVHRISYSMVKDYPTFAEQLSSLISFIGEDMVVCHNTPFDMGFMYAYCERAGITFLPPLGDTLTMSRRLYPYLKSRSLSSVAEHLQVSAEGYHRALSDAMVTAQIYIKMLSALCSG